MKKKKVYETPTVKKVEFNFSTMIAASTCGAPTDDMNPCIFGL